MISRVRAIIIKDNKILTIKRTKPNETYWCCPGGQVESGESNESALIRECKEELGLDVKVAKMYHEMESQKPATKGQQEYFYICEILGGELGSGDGPEFQSNSDYIGGYDIEWIDIEKIKDRPQQVADILYQ